MLAACDRIIIVPDESLRSAEIPGFQSIDLTHRKGESELLISPCRDEHWISTDLFKLRMYCDERNITITSIGSYNQFPFYSMFSDKVIVGPTTKQPTWYSPSGKRVWVHSSNSTECPIEVTDVERDPFRKVIRNSVSSQAVVDRFTYRSVYILQSAYDLYLEKQPPRDLFVCESKSRGSDYPFRVEMAKQTEFEVVGLNHDFQSQWVQTIGRDRYMSFQILCSTLSNWQYFCCGGSSNLMCVLPMKTLFLSDVCMWAGVREVIKGCSRLRYGMPPVIGGVYDSEESGEMLKKFLPQMKRYSKLLTTAPLPEIHTLQS